MKRIVILILSFYALNAFAGDTLTRAQVYNFSVGDTFDYKNENFGYDNEDFTHDSTWNYFSYYRVIIVGKFNSQNLDTLFYARKILGRASNFVNTNNIIFDTVAIDSNSNYAVFDSMDFCGDNLCSINVDTGYNHRVVDSATICGDVGCQSGNDVYAVGLGVTISARGIGDGNGRGISDITTLIYYSQAGEIWGTPYYNFPTGLQQLNAANSRISLYPTVNNGTFNLKINDGTLLPLNIVIYDITGREIKKLNLNNLNNNINIQPTAAGTYIWKAQQQGQLLQTGKLVVY